MPAVVVVVVVENAVALDNANVADDGSSALLPALPAPVAANTGVTSVAAAAARAVAGAMAAVRDAKDAAAARIVARRSIVRGAVSK